MNLTEQALDIFTRTLTYVDPSRVLPSTLTFNPDSGKMSVNNQTFVLGDDQNIYIIGAGKASAEMARAAVSVLGDRITDGIVISPNEYAEKEKIQVFKGSHPLPDIDTLSSSYELVSFIKTIPPGSVVLNMISGGASSLFCIPSGELEIDEIREIYSLLIESGATIQEINTVRKVFSSVKGGQILKWLNGSTLIDLMISDITDDQIGMIGSGPSVAQTISATQGFQVLKKYGIYQKIPHAARRLLATQMDQEVKNKDYRTTSDIPNHHSFIIASATMMAQKAAEIAREKGFEVTLNQTPWDGPIEHFEKHISEMVSSQKGNAGTQACITFGEPTVQVTGKGLGGRNQELALRMAIELKNFDRQVAFLSAGTDGIDGPTDAAGAIITEKTYEQAHKAGLNPEEFIANNDSYHFFEKLEGHIKPGPTGNNLMDIQITLMD